MIADRTCRAVSFFGRAREEPFALCGAHRPQGEAVPGAPGVPAEYGEIWRVLRAKFPPAIASHSAVQDFYFGPDFLLRRHDYELEVSGGLAAAQYVHDFVASGFPASKERVERLMRDNGIRARHKRRYKVTTDSKHKLPVAENLLARSFTPTAPNQVLAEYGMRCSMSRKGNCQDNFFNSLKNERVHATRYRTHQEAMADLFEYIEVFYSRSRRHSSLGFVSPVQFLQNWLKAQQTEDAAA
jgi:hypothetical protein